MKETIESTDKTDPPTLADLLRDKLLPNTTEPEEEVKPPIRKPVELTELAIRQEPLTDKLLPKFSDSVAVRPETWPD